MSRAYQKAEIDRESRDVVRRCVKSWVLNKCSKDYTLGISNFKWGSLIKHCRAGVDNAIESGKISGAKCSVQAIAEEIDFILPKTVKVLRFEETKDDGRFPEGTYIDPERPPFKQRWFYMFPNDTPWRLGQEYARYLERTGRFGLNRIR